VQETISNSKKKAALVVYADLIGYYLEHHIKQYYGELIKSLELLLTSTISHVKKTSISLLTSLTKHK
jgi:hypothetical protein